MVSTLKLCLSLVLLSLPPDGRHKPPPTFTALYAAGKLGFWCTGGETAQMVAPVWCDAFKNMERNVSFP